MLPTNENILDMLSCADYRTLVYAKLAHARLLHLISKSAEKLAHRRNFEIQLDENLITIYADSPVGASRHSSIPYEPGSQEALAAACRQVAGVIGPHAVVQLIFTERTWNMPGVGVVFTAAPPLKYAESVHLASIRGSTISGNSDALMSHFVRMKELELWVHYEVFRQFDWTFLRRESERSLRLVVCIVSPCSTEDLNRSTEELIRYCITLPRLRGGKPLELDLSKYDFPSAFGLRIIEMLKDTGCELTFRMRTLREDMLVLHEADYTVAVVDATITRYASDESGIVVEVKGPLVTIQSTAVVPRKKPRTSGELLPFVEQ